MIDIPMGLLPTAATMTSRIDRVACSESYIVPKWALAYRSYNALDVSEFKYYRINHSELFANK